MIDVSEYQGSIDWRKVYGHGVRRAYIKCTEGGTYVDSRCKQNVHDARKEGIQVGLYHYGHPVNSPLRDWRNFLRNAQGLIRPGDLPPALDLEVTEGHDWKYLNDWKAQWLHASDLAVNLEHGSVFYSYFYFLKNMILYPDRPVWGALYGLIPSEQEHRWSIWQHTAHGTVPGISGYVDFDKVLKPIEPVPVAL